jgi:phosphomannomutase
MQDGEPPGAAAISFGTDGWRATLETFTDDRVRMVGQAVASYLEGADAAGAVAVGYDAREHSRGFADSLADVLRANGYDVVLPERNTPTPVVAWTVTERDLAGALMVTASHNPPDYNGVKFIPAGGAPALPAVTDELEGALAAPTALPEADHGGLAETDLISPYLDTAWTTVATARGDRVALDGLAVAYDAMHGSGRGVTDRLLDRAGADLARLRCEPEPTFGGGAPEPVPERAEALVERVQEGPAALGIINDGDADRVAVVTPERGFLDPNLLFAALADDLLAASDGDLVRTVSTSSIVDRVAEAHGQAVHETPVGFKWVAEAMGEHDALMGGEESGGFGLTSHLRNKDGVLIALLAAAAHAEESLDTRIDRLLDTHGEIHQDRVSVDCPDEHKAAVIDALEDEIPETVAGEGVADVTTVDGFKLTLADGTWLLVRPSGTEPKLRVYAEAGSEERIEQLLAAGEDIVAPLV